MFVNARAIIERETDRGTEILLQVRNRTGEERRLELPGGRVEELEPLLEALAREVREETGLTVTAILDETDRVVTETRDFTVECLRPFCVYQTTRGPIDSVGFFFRCRAEGELLAQGDDTLAPRWMPVHEMADRFARDPDQFDWLTQGALQFYLRWVRDRSVRRNGTPAGE